MTYIAYNSATCNSVSRSATSAQMARDIAKERHGLDDVVVIKFWNDTTASLAWNDTGTGWPLHKARKHGDVV